MKNWRIVVADDEPECLSLMIEVVLGTFGRNAKVLGAPDGEAAYELIKERTAHLVLSDYNMPRLSGGDLAARLAAEGRLPALPFIIITGGLDAEAHEGLAQIGIRRIVAKPYRLKELRGWMLEAVGCPAETELAECLDDGY